ncbi:MAG: hypothetical protein LBK73_00030 [Treponema sp.]|jgi:hypothetical protein|nr:hypothetical protein [Treponema sp.]
MKKTIALTVIMAVFSTTAFAAPLSATGSSDALSGEISLSSQPDANLFAGAAALTSEEAQAAEGAGFFGAIPVSVSTPKDIVNTGIAETFAINGQTNKNLTNIIVTERNMSGASYKFAGGMSLGFADLYKATAGVADNDVIIKKAKRWRAASMGLASFSAVASVFAVGSLIQREKKLSDAGLYAAIGLFVSAIIAGDLCQQNTQKAVNNYNLYIMGIPVK